MKKAEERIWIARITIYVLAFLYIAFGILGELKNPSGEAIRTIGITVAIAGIFIAFAVMAKENPFNGILGALILYCLLFILELVLIEFSFVRTLLVRAGIITLLVRGLMVARDYERWIKESKQP